MKLFAVLRNEENLLYIEIDNSKKGNIFSKKKIIWRSFERISSPYYKVYDEEIKKINDSNDLRKKDKYNKSVNVLNSLCCINY